MQLLFLLGGVNNIVENTLHDWLINWFIGWLIDWLRDWSIAYFYFLSICSQFSYFYSFGVFLVKRADIEGVGGVNFSPRGY